MPVFRTFRAIRPEAGYAAGVSCLPYDVMNRREAAEMAKGNPYSFLRVVRSEIDFDAETDPYDEKVYQKAKDNLDEMIGKGILIQDDSPKYYIYRQVMDGRAQTGLAGCASVDDYLLDVIKKHEFTRPEKEIDRINHFCSCNANTEPVFLTYKANEQINDILADWIRSNKPVYDFTSEDGIAHSIWVIEDERKLDKIYHLFEDIDYFYIADGHHRSASAVKTALKKRQEITGHKGDEEYNYFMAVAFPDDELLVMDYNRLVRDLNGLGKEEFLEKAGAGFLIEPCEEIGPYRPHEKHTFGMFLEDQWYKLTAIKGTFHETDPVESLDASILQNNLLGPVLGISDPRTDKRIDFVGGIRGLSELEKRVSEKEMAVAFSLYPVTISDLMRVADTGNVMPPKSTWFEPKLRSGLFIHKLDENE